MPPKSAASNKTSRSKPERRPVETGIPPSSTRDPNKPQVNKELEQRNKKELISVFQSELDKKQAANDREAKETLGQIHYLRKENDRIQRKQIAEYGVTLDTLDDLASNYEHVKLQNDKLYENMAQSKTLYDKLEQELRETKQRYKETVHKIETYTKDSKMWETTNERFLRAEARCSDLRQNNKKLKYILLKHHIDPTTDVREFSREFDKDSVTTMRTYKSEPLPKRKLTVKSRYHSIGNVDEMREMNRQERTRGLGVNDKVFDQVSPAYLGYYVRKREARRELEYYRPGEMLPRVMANNVR